MTRGRMRSILGQVHRASPKRLVRLYEEVYGAHVGSTVSEERVRASIIEALEEQLERGSYRHGRRE